ncbi:hypothetical protein A3K93_09950 [Acinetobacter sp. NCu2D-2]|uniref:hypothetical protein n=1 Tax=Acinetobacter sp. NCu2D-2 TaxID=1608473 RepID=UPI0007CDFE03|nr:hypothetical protein [Acinetobacter sp. NCu2D-2]ANF82480.1 hypothetical protein A3K93_09950 [Acinetobacter sp. NCu2D-2]
MPIDAVLHSIHLRRKKNAVVFRNIDRLWDLARTAQSHQDLLDGLHPWNASTTLKFENTLPIFLAGFGFLQMLSLIIAPANIWFQLNFGMGCFMLFWAYLVYETKQPIQDVILHLEETALSKKYALQFDQQPQYLNVKFNTLQFIGHLKRLFPIFDRGTLSNEINRFASTVWEDESGQKHDLVIFQYHYIDELQIRDKNGDRVTVKEIHKDLWGVFVFNIETQGLAVTTNNRKFYYPYTSPWHSSDIQANQRLKFYGTDSLQTAKMMSPGFVLRLTEFFHDRQGDLLFHPEQRVMCYLGPHDLFKVSSRQKQITDISTLRGHLRTFKLAELERLQSALLTFLK